MQNTANYQLPTWEQDDQIKMSDFNAMTAKLDAALAAEAAARESAVSAEISARETAVSAEQSARAGALAAVAKNLGAAGHNLRVATGTYAGTGALGSANANSLSFGFYPVAVFIAPVTTGSQYAQNPAVFLRGRSIASYGSEAADMGAVRLTWGESGVSWYYGSSGTWAGYQLNESGRTYCYVVLGYDKAAEEA